MNKNIQLYKSYVQLQSVGNPSKKHIAAYYAILQNNQTIFIYVIAEGKPSYKMKIKFLKPNRNLNFYFIRKNKGSINLKNFMIHKLKWSKQVSNVPLFFF